MISQPASRQATRVPRPPIPPLRVSSATRPSRARALVVGSGASRAVLAAGERVEQALVKVGVAGGAAEVAEHGLQVLGEEGGDAADLVEGLLEGGGQALLGDGEGEAAQVVALGDVGGVEEALGEVGEVDADEAVGLADVAAELEGLGGSC